MSTINAVAHGLNPGQAFYFANVIPTEAGIDETLIYYVITAGLTADAFQFSDTIEGTPITLAEDIISGSIIGLDDYVELAPEEVPDTAVVTTIRDMVAPAIPSGVATAANVNGAFVSWSPTTARDLLHYEVRYAPDRGDGLGPDETNFTQIRAKTTTVYIGNLKADINEDGIPDARYWFEVRAVDVAGNVQPWQGTGTAAAATDVITLGVNHRFNPDDAVRVTGMTGGTGLLEDTTYYVLSSGLTPTELKLSLTVGGAAVDITVDYTDLTVTGYPGFRDFNQEPNVGWSMPVSVNPTLVGSAEVEYQSIGTEHVKVTGLSAEVIKTGTLKINTTDINMADGLQVYADDGVTLIGLWNESGLYIYNEDNTTNYVRVFDGGISVFLNGVETTAITPDGINATAVNFGSMPGGHNVVLNSSFELSGFVAAPATATWDVTADFTGTQVSISNASNSNNITITNRTY